MNRHLLFMIFCCAVSLGLIFSLPYVGLDLSSGILFFAIALLYPLLYLLVTGRREHRSGKPRHHLSKGGPDHD